MKDRKLDLSFWKEATLDVKAVEAKIVDMDLKSSKYVMSLMHTDKIKLDNMYSLSHNGRCFSNFNSFSYFNSNAKLKIDGKKYSINSTLDLHGYTLTSAHSKLESFITENYFKNSRCLLIITGYGNKTLNTGTIRANFLNWLESDKIKHMILYCNQAVNKHGGNGAYYVILKKGIAKHTFQI
ncbi:Smr/MutS family protein [Wolbachia endosymbiont of Pentidionis agamae]|uniref:Smr/MutS family protein n=1 Tax=Wolbachia endosymbiont of Pentidionis agamae TaxID=3110435 RepID=UPI002FCEBCE7